jgi:hypothetical protein
MLNDDDETTDGPVMIDVFHVPLGEQPKVVQVNRNSLRDIAQLIDGGYLEMVAIDTDVVMMVDEDGLRKRLKPNFRVGDQTIVGPAFFCRRDGGELASVTPDDIERIRLACRFDER